MKTIRKHFEEKFGEFPKVSPDLTSFIKETIEESPKDELDKDFYGGFLFGCYEKGFVHALAYAVLFEDNGVPTETLKKALLIAEGIYNASTTI